MGTGSWLVVHTLLARSAAKTLRGFSVVVDTQLIDADKRNNLAFGSIFYCSGTLANQCMHVSVNPIFSTEFTEGLLQRVLPLICAPILASFYALLYHC